MGTYDEILARSGLTSNGFIQTKYVPGVIQEAITQSVCMKLMRREPNMSTKTESRPVMSLFPEAYWVETEAGETVGEGEVEAEKGLLETSTQQWTNATITAAKMGVVIPIPKDTIADLAEGYDLWGEIKPRLGESIARKFDQAVLTGTGAPAAFPDDILTDATSASMVIDKSDSVGAEKTFKDMYDAVLGEGGLFGLVEGKRYRVDGIVADVSQMAVLRGLRSSDGIPLWSQGNGQGAPSYTLGGIPVTFPENDSLNPASALMIAGNWKKTFYAWRQDIQLSMSDTAVVTDATGAIKLNSFQQEVVLLKATCRLGWCCPIPVDIAGTANRFPFAVLKA